jgi:iron complex outermembrane receptor protein
MFIQRSTNSVVGCSIAVVAALAASAAAAADNKAPAIQPLGRIVTYSLDIPAQDLNSALRQLALASHYKLFYRAELVAGKTAPALKGHFTTEQAIRTLLDGTGLVYEITPSSVVVIKRPGSEPVAYSMTDVSANTLHLAQATSSRVAEAEAEKQTEMASAEPPMPGRTLQEIVVSAQKRRENVQRVPITVAAFDEKSIELLQIDDARDLSQAVPGLTYISISGAFGAQLRGFAVGNPGGGPWQEPSVSTYVDGVYYVNSTASNLMLDNLAQIEVSKGPQGTLFGRNAVAGVISIATKDPEHTPAANVRIGYGNFDTWKASFYGTAGITENLAGSIALATEQQGEGWGTNLYDGSPSYISEESYSARSKLKWTPGDNTTVTFIADWAFGQNPGTFAFTRGVYPFITIGPSHVGGYYDSYGPPGLRESRSSGASLKIEHDFSWAQLVSITAYREDRANTNIPYAFSVPYLPDTPAVGQVAGLKPGTGGSIYSNATTQEFQLLSPSNSTIKWIGGVFVLFNEAGNEDRTDQRTAPPTGVVKTIISNEQSTESYSAFAEMTAPLFADHTRATLGVRYTRDDRSIEGAPAVRNSVAAPDVYVPVLSTAAAANPRPKGTWDEVTYRAVLEHDLRDDVLGYASFATGFQSAYYNMANTSANPPLEPVTVDAYEVGVKAMLFDSRLRANASLFLYNVDNVVVSRNIGGTQSLSNAASSRYQGIDVDLTLRATQNLTLSTAFEYLDPEYTDYQGMIAYVPNANGITWRTVGIDGTGAQVQYTEKVMGTASASYEVPTRFGTFSLTGSATYHGKRNHDTQGLNVHPSYTLVNSSVTYTPTQGQWSAKVWARNLTNEKYAEVLFPSDIVMMYSAAAPRTYGIQFEYDWH